MKAIILAAGKSTRTYPLTLTRPKPLLPIANKPILVHQLEALKGLVDEVIVVVGYLHEMIEEYFGNGFGNIGLTYVEQKEQKGTGHAVLQCAGRLDEPFLVLNGDDLYEPGDLAALAASPQGVLAHMMEDPRNFGVFEVDKDMRVIGVEEKPEALEPRLANNGAYKLLPEVFAILEGVEPSARGEIELTSALQVLADGGDFFAVERKGYWFPIGYPWDLLEANAALIRLVPDKLEGEVSPAAHLSGGPIFVGKGSVVRPGAVIEGPVVIGEGCVIGPNCWIRPETAIGDNCRVGQGVELKGTILFEGARVPHLSYVGDSVIGANANIACGTITANVRHDNANHRSRVNGEMVDTGRRKLGAIVGDNVHTGINTSLYPGRKLWPGTSTRPGQAVDRDIEGTD